MTTATRIKIAPMEKSDVEATFDGMCRAAEAGEYILTDAPRHGHDLVMFKTDEEGACLSPVNLGEIVNVDAKAGREFWVTTKLCPKIAGSSEIAKIKICVADGITLRR